MAPRATGRRARSPLFNSAHAPLVACLLALSLGLASSSAFAQAHAQPDAAKHVAVSLSLAGAGYGLSALVLEPTWQRASAGMLLATAAGGAKELLDLAGTGDPSWRDMGWNLVGAAFGTLLALGLDLSCETPENPVVVGASGTGVRIRF